MILFFQVETKKNGIVSVVLQIHTYYINLLAANRKLLIVGRYLCCGLCSRGACITRNFFKLVIQLQFNHCACPIWGQDQHNWLKLGLWWRSEVLNSINKNLAQQCVFQKVWKILLFSEIFSEIFRFFFLSIWKMFTGNIEKNRTNQKNSMVFRFEKIVLIRNPY